MSISPAPITLQDVVPISNAADFKLHLASASGGVHPLPEYLADRENWLEWNRSRGHKNEWTRPYIFSFIEFYPISNAWLFGGVFRIVDRQLDHYVIAECPEYAKFEGRLICRFQRYQGMRGRAFYLENHLDNFTVLQVLAEPYSGEIFPGYQNVNHSFEDLEVVVRRDRQDWKAPLLAVKGVYLVLDSQTGKAYVGSAYGEAALWSRLCCYVNTGHGWNDDLVTTIGLLGADYARTHFRFSILEVFTYTTSDETILKRESHWKNVLLTRTFGHNRN